ncbi:MAG: DinB family protein [Magnetospirillum sp.]|nr:DinB family protein [Magnetospirillum sp.]
MDAAHFATLARYNRWANERLYQACAAAGDGEIKRGRPSFFGSIHATLNHILVGDRAWVGRIENADYGITALDQILYEDFAELRAARAAFDEHIVTLMGGLSGDLDRPLEYRSMAGDPARAPLVWALTHLFNHQTHHRGQVHAMLSQTAVPPPALDLIYFIRGQ